MRERQIEVFRAVMDYGGISKASETLHISQPAASRMISDLEAETGLNLFERSGRNVKPTPEAHQLKREVDTFFIGLDRVANAAKEIRELRRGHVRMTVMPALALSIAPAIMLQLTEKHPTVKTTLDVHTSPRIADLIASGQFELGIGHLTNERPEVEVMGVWRVDCVCVMPRDHPLSNRTILRPKDLADEELVSLSYHTDTAKYVHQAFLAEGLRPRIRIEAQPSYAACALAIQGLGIAIVDVLTAEYFRSERMVVTPFGPGIPFEFKLMRPSNARPSAVAEAFAQMAFDVIDANPLTIRHT